MITHILLTCLQSAVAPSDYADFRAMFPAFDAVPDSTLALWFARAARQVDTSWTEGDREFGLWLLAAHLMTEQGLGTGAEAEMAAAGALGFRSMKSGSLSLERFAGTAGEQATGWGTTSYGRQFAVLVRQNKGGARVTDNGVLPVPPFPFGRGGLPGW